MLSYSVRFAIHIDSNNLAFHSVLLLIYNNNNGTQGKNIYALFEGQIIFTKQAHTYKTFNRTKMHVSFQRILNNSLLRQMYI